MLSQCVRQAATLIRRLVLRAKPNNNLHRHHSPYVETNSGSRISIGMFEKIRCFAQRANHFLNLHAARLGDFTLNRFDVEVLSDLSHRLTDCIGECVDRREVVVFKYIRTAVLSCAFATSIFVRLRRGWRIVSVRASPAISPVRAIAAGWFRQAAASIRHSAAVLLHCRVFRHRALADAAYAARPLHLRGGR